MTTKEMTDAPVSFIKGGLQIGSQVHLEGTFAYLDTEMASWDSDRQVIELGDVYFEQGIRAGFPPASETYLSPSFRDRVMKDMESAAMAKGVRDPDASDEQEQVESATAAAIEAAFAEGEEKGPYSSGVPDPVTADQISGGIVDVSVAGAPGKTPMIPEELDLDEDDVDRDTPAHIPKEDPETGEPIYPDPRQPGGPEPPREPGEEPPHTVYPPEEEEAPAEPAPKEPEQQVHAAPSSTPQPPWDDAEDLNIAETKARLATATDDEVDQFVVWEESRERPRVTLLRELEE